MTLTVTQRDSSRPIHHDSGRGMQPERSLSLQLLAHFPIIFSLALLELSFFIATSSYHRLMPQLYRHLHHHSSAPLNKQPSLDLTDAKCSYFSYWIII
jgi:hypothetical protein